MRFFPTVNHIQLNSIWWDISFTNYFNRRQSVTKEHPPYSSHLVEFNLVRQSLLEMEGLAARRPQYSGVQGEIC